MKKPATDGSMENELVRFQDERSCLNRCYGHLFSRKDPEYRAYQSLALFCSFKITFSYTDREKLRGDEGKYLCFRNCLRNAASFHLCNCNKNN